MGIGLQLNEDDDDRVSVHADNDFLDTQNSQDEEGDAEHEFPAFDNLPKK